MVFGKWKTRKIFSLTKPCRTYTTLSNEGKQLEMDKKKCLTKLTRKNDKGKVRLFFSFLVFKEKKEWNLLTLNTCYLKHMTIYGVW